MKLSFIGSFFIMDRNTHKALLKEYQSLGGDQMMVKKLSSFSLSSHSKLRYLIKQLNINPDKDNDIDQSDSITLEALVLQERESKFSDLISNYPQQLHSVFKSRYDQWLTACSLKQQLNSIEFSDEKTALDIQWKIVESIELMEGCQRALDHYNKFKRILPVKSSVNFDDLSPIDLLKKRNNLRSNITKRSKTLKEMEANLPDKSSKEYNLKLHLVNRKREQIQDYKNQVLELDKLINN
ncbi:hypothetical protein [Chryseobacterium sp.]|uniref:hypothetical protein n=1 Tax=Chryseobacterium sp. TaxID=1871047 RepID=UPI002639D6D4|nr:hypothetical protein [Chryseobacterium sp.]